MEPTTGQKEGCGSSLGAFCSPSSQALLWTLAVFSSCGLDGYQRENEFCKVVRKRHTTEKGILKRHVEIISRKKKKKYKWTIKPEEKNVRLTSKRNAG